MCTALGGEIHGLSGSVVEGESELGEASRAGGKTGGECIAGRLALAVGFEPALHVCPCRGVSRHGRVGAPRFQLIP